MLKFLPIFLYLLQNVQGLTRVDPLVDTQYGLIRGLKATDGDYSMFLGIPYAIVDKENPFGPSSPHPGFDNVFEAYDDSAICPQIEEFNNTIVGTLDCLHLNVYVPNSASSRERLPVLVWIYGGGFSIGFSGRYVYGPSYLVRHDIILVTLNYRLGPYGFMCLKTPEVPGNQGLKDQRLALQWVKSNIESFGGDANKITIFGESAGAASVDLQLYYGEDNLFNKIILQSGSASNSWSVKEPDVSAPLKLAEHLGFPSTDINLAVSFLTGVDTSLVIAAVSETGLEFWPCVEESFENVEIFISDHPININIPKIRRMPVLLGYNNNEWLSKYANKQPEFYENLNVFYDNLKKSFDFEENELTDIEEIVRHFYIGDEIISQKEIWGLSNFESDISFYHPTARSIHKYIDNGAANIYQYMFSYVGERNFVKKLLNITIGGAVHADEISYLFDVSYMKEKPTPEDQLTIDRITTLWTNFVKYGDPTPEITELLYVKWEPITKDIFHYLNIDSEISVQKRPFNDRMAFWDLFYKINEKAQKGYKVIL